ncbi:MAG: hypothetical protein QNJ29_09195 [Rhizobiaceae bacterium]|nr:hypothetical protein [Rhizobiaceae bacterium]
MKLAGVELNDFHHIISDYSASIGLFDAFEPIPGNVFRFCEPVSISPPEVGAENSSDINAALAKFRDRYDADGVDPSFRGMNSYWSIADWWNTERPKEHQKLLFWLDGTLDWQLSLAKLCYLYEQSHDALPELYVIEPTTHSYDLPFSSLSIMNPKWLVAAQYKVSKFDRVQVSLFADVWRAFCQDEPFKQIAELNKLDLSSASRFALKFLRSHYPKETSGLTDWQETLLRYAIQQKPEAIRIIGYAIGSSNSPDHFGDIKLFDELLALGATDLDAPLLKLSGNLELMRETNVEVLPLAHDVLDGKENFSKLNGIERWIGGVHLTPENLVYQEDLISLFET